MRFQNSSEILGLSPQQLFSLECFTDTLPDLQASSLWDNIEILSNTDQLIDSDAEEEEAPIFLLSGWGAPNIVSPEERRAWTCWCAIHRPRGSKAGLIVMELEPENDLTNPIFPPVGMVQGPVAVGSPGSTQSADASEGTMVAASAAASAMTTPVDGLEGEEDGWAPSMTDVLESTTSWARPLTTLDRLRRRIRKPTTVTEPFLTDPSNTRRRRKHNVSTLPERIGILDMLAVMSQISDQLGSANDLDIFVKVLVGVIKDLTQFHRVLVYQFDEVWNGKVVAELVDWKMDGTVRDLWKGLSFPAADIPIQARELYAISEDNCSLSVFARPDRYFS